MSLLSAIAAGIDVHKKFVAVAILSSEDPNRPVSTRRFGTTWQALEELENYLRVYHVTHVAMESTAQYWRPVWDWLEGKFELFLAQARSTQAPHGRKTDNADALRIARRLIAGDLTLSYVPPPPQREARLLTRHVVALKAQISDCRNEIETLLEQAHLKLTSVVSDTFGFSGRRILRALVAGETDPEKLAALGHRRLKVSREELAEALRGALTAAQKLVLRLILDRVERLEKDIEEIDRALLAHQSEHAEALRRLCEIPGVGLWAAQQLIAEIGPSASAFDSPGRLASWIGVCPGMHESGGKSASSRSAKGNRYLRRLVCQIAWAATLAKQSEARTRYFRLRARLGPLKAVWAIAHYLVRVVWKVLHCNEEFRHTQPQSLDPHTALQRAAKLKRNLAKLGFTLNITGPDLQPIQLPS